jgi:hypothetical protein
VLDGYAEDLHGAHGFDPAASRDVLAAIRSAGQGATRADPLGAGDVTVTAVDVPREDVTVLPVRRLRSHDVLAPPVPPEAVATAGGPPAPPSGKDGRRSRPVAIIVAVVVAALLAGTVLGYVVGHSTGDDGSTATVPPSTAPSVTSNPFTDLSALRTQLATAVQHAADLEGQVKTLTGEAEDAQGQVTSLQGQLQSAQSQLQATQSQLSAMSAALPVDLSALDLTGSYTAGGTNVESCEGFNDGCTTFLTRYSFQAAPDPGSPGNLLISSYYFANKPLTRYGTTFVSQGSVDRGTAMCNGSAQATSYTLTLVPQAVTLAGSTVVVSTVVGDLTYASPAGGGCRDATARVSFTATRG